MRITLFAVVRIAVASAAVLTGAALLTQATNPRSDVASATVASLNDGPAPTPYCDPSDRSCKIPTMNPW